MRIQLTMEGGIAFFPGLNKPIIVDTEALSQHDQAEVQRLLQETHFFELSDNALAPSYEGADRQRYTITIEDDDTSHILRLVDPIQNPHFQALVQYLRQLR